MAYEEPSLTTDFPRLDARIKGAIEAELAKLDYETAAAIRVFEKVCLADAEFRKQFQYWFARLLDAFLRAYLTICSEEDALHETLTSVILPHAVKRTLEQRWCLPAIGREIACGFALYFRPFETWQQQTDSEDGYWRGALVKDVIEDRWLFWRAELLAVRNSATEVCGSKPTIDFDEPSGTAATAASALLPNSQQAQAADGPIGPQSLTAIRRERRALLTEYKQAWREAGKKETDTTIAKAANPRCNDRTPVQRWLRADPRSTPADDARIRAVLRRRPHLSFASSSK